MATPDPLPPLHRYHRQMLLPGIGHDGQTRLAQSRVLLVGCGALGSVIADSLTRAGVGQLTIVDRDVVEITNLQRQVLFDEEDVANGVPKAEAARHRLGRINSEVEVRAFVDDFNHRNAERFVRDADILLDGLDNFETRYLLNDLAVAHHLPYVYGGAVGVSGMSMTVLPHGSQARTPGPRHITWSDDQATACLRCVFPAAPPPGVAPTCDTAGVLGPVVVTVAAHQAAQAIKLLAGHVDAIDRTLLSMDVWNNETRRIKLARAPSCPCCGDGLFEYIEGDASSSATSLCGRNAVQITAARNDGAAAVDLGLMAERLAEHGQFRRNEFLLHGTFREERSPKGDPIELTLFPNGRAILVGTTEPEVARAIYAKYIGS